jgi:hypothetical protein
MLSVWLPIAPAKTVLGASPAPMMHVDPPFSSRAIRNSRAADLASQLPQSKHAMANRKWRLA